MIINESIAEALEWGLTNLEYHTLGQKYGNYRASNYNHADGEQFWYRGYDDYYTPLFIDLMDDNNQRDKNYGSLLYPNDNVKDYSFSYLESLLFGARNLDLLNAMLKMNKPAGVSNEDIDLLINFCINL